MYYYRRVFAALVLSFLGAVPAAFGQSTPAPEPVPVRRWLDVESVHAASRFRWIENSAGRVTSSTIQWQAQARGRFLFDGEGRYTIGALASTGAAFPSSWNNTGAGLGRVTHPFNVKQLFFAAAPGGGLELQIGGLFMDRGELLEQIAYDNDAYIVGERVTWRPAGSRLTQVSVTAGFFGGSDFSEVNVFKRLDRLDDFNYGQALIRFAPHASVRASIDYTYEDGRDILREGLTIRVPESVRFLRSVRIESYQRLEPDRTAGFNAAADLRLGQLAVTGGVMSVDRAYGPYNGDRYETGTRYYAVFTYPLTPELSAQFFHTKAFDVDFAIPIAHRYDIVLTVNPTAALKRARVF
jgi:hypothetical protein